MLIELAYLKKKYRLNITGILHVGAHEAEERPDYLRLGVKNLTWVEANEKRCSAMRKRFPDKVLCAVVSDVNGEKVTFNEANNGQSSSILELGTHKKAHPEVHYVSKEVRTAERLDHL